MFKKLQMTLVLVVMVSVSAFAQTRTIVGVVTDASTGETLTGVSIAVDGTQRGTSTNIDGEYSIRASSNNVLVFSFLGFSKQEIPVGNQTTINVALDQDIQNLDEVIVTGYGAIARRQITSSIGQVSSDQLADVSITTADQALQGRVAGVQITGTSGVLGAPTNIRIRGASSISASTVPLVVVDGVPITNPAGTGISAIGSGYGGQGINPLINLNPADIESYEVLKDASASAIYGSRGSNGVILITTKKGRSGSQNVSVNYYGGFTNETNRYDMMSGPEFAKIWNDALMNRYGQIVGLEVPEGDDAVSTDWGDIVAHTGFVQEGNASVSGGNDATQYYISGTFRSEEGYTKRNQLDRYAARVRVDHSVSDDFKVGLSVTPTRTENFRVATSNAVAAPFTYSALHFPNVAAYNEDGSINYGVAPNAIQVFPGNPLGNQEGTDFISTLQQVVASANAEYLINDNFMFNTDFTADLFQLQERQKVGGQTTDGFPVGAAFASNDQYLNYNLNATVTYKNNWEDNNLTILAGTSLQKSERTNFSSSGNTFANDKLKTLNSAATITGGGGSGASFAFQGYLSRINYSYKDRYLLTVTGRYDGSSRFGEENRYGFFPAASAGWIVTDEDFLQSDIIDFLKLRSSYGITGNAEIGNFPSLGLIGFGGDYSGLPGGSLSQLANPGLKWERTTQVDFGLDYGFLGSRIRGAIAYFIKDTDDLLLNKPVSSVNGFSTFTDNIGAIKNSGIEFDLTADILQGSVSWTSSFNISSIDNEVISIVDGQDQIFGNNIVREGEPLGAFYLVRYAGVNRENGNAQYLDLDGNLTDQYSLSNRVIAGSPFPDYFGGFTNTFAYKGVDLGIFFQYSYGNMTYRGDGGFTDTNLSSLFNQSTRQNDYWSEDNPDAANPEPRFLVNNGASSSTRYLEDASYLRLKSLSLGYTLPVNLTQGYTARIYAQGTNLLTFTKDSFNGLDPEAVGAGNIQSADVFFQPPQQRTITFGVNLTF